MPKRECGGCVICCKLIACGDLDKPANTWCNNAVPGKGCKIHKDRPEACTTFFCEWLIDDSIPEELRPDKSRVVLELVEDFKLCLAIVEPSRPDAWKNKRLKAFYDKLNRGGIAVVTTTGPESKYNILVPKGRSAQEVKNDLERALKSYHGA